MDRIALFGAGGKMGVRLARNLRDTRFKVKHVEVSPEGVERLRAETGAACVPQAEALADAEALILAVPDRLIGKVLHAISDQVRPGTRVIMLDAAAPYAGELPDRPI